MIWRKLSEIDGAGLITMESFTDERGFFQEMYNRKTFVKNGIPLPFNWAQDNISYSHPGVIRGLHLQRNNPQGKLVTCLMGRIIDVCFDVRPKSPTFKRAVRVELSSDEPCSFWLPPGTAHGFVAIQPSLIHYRCSTPYDKESDTGINAFSPEFESFWPSGTYVRSQRDRSLPMLMDYLKTLP